MKREKKKAGILHRAYRCIPADEESSQAVFVPSSDLTYSLFDKEKRTIINFSAWTKWRLIFCVECVGSRWLLHLTILQTTSVCVVINSISQTHCAHSMRIRQSSWKKEKNLLCYCGELLLGFTPCDVLIRFFCERHFYELKVCNLVWLLRENDK